MFARGLRAFLTRRNEMAAEAGTHEWPWWPAGIKHRSQSGAL